MYGTAMAAGYDRGRRMRPEDIHRWMTAARPYLPGAGGRILDLGAGTGRFSDPLARATGATVVACEPSAAMRAACRSANALILGGAAEAAPFRTGVFDAVWASQMIHHIDDLPAFAANLRRILRPGGHLLLRGGFGPVQDLPLFRYFPAAWADGEAVRLSLDRITGALAASGLDTANHIRIEQTLADNTDELIEKVATRTLSNLARLPDTVFRQGLDALRRDPIDGPVRERLDLVIFRAA